VDETQISGWRWSESAAVALLALLIEFAKPGTGKRNLPFRLTLLFMEELENENSFLHSFSLDDGFACKSRQKDDRAATQRSAGYECPGQESRHRHGQRA
jgi:hypothetical protein